MNEKWLEDPLGYLIGAERTDDFFARYYESEALIVAHEAPRRFAELVSIDDIDRIVTNVDLHEGQIDLADASRELSRDDYMDSGGLADRGAIADLHRAGATIILQHAHQLDPKLSRFCRSMEHVFSSHVQTNLYLTPPNAQGFRTHYDNHDVFVVQVTGEKAWRLYEKPVDTPYRGEHFEHGKHESGELKQEFTLKAGDCAYVPRGLMHDASTSGDEASLHITVGLITRTWADLMLEAVSEAALRLPSLRRSLPAGFARPDFNRDAARAQLRTLTEELAPELRLDPALELLIDTFIRSRAADNRGAVRDAARPIGAGDSFRRQPHALCRIAEDDDDLIVIAPGGELKFAPADREALERALNGETFTSRALGEGADAIVGRLLAYGLVARV